MPIYEYHCFACRKNFEKLILREEEEKDLRCECGSKKFQKLLSLPAVKSDKGDNSYPYWEENITDKPILLESPAHRAKVLKQHGLSEKGKEPGMPGQMV